MEVEKTAKQVEREYLTMKEKSERILKLAREGVLKNPSMDLRDLFEDVDSVSRISKIWSRKAKREREEEKQNVNI